jgi:hypothetical protein
MKCYLLLFYSALVQLSYAQSTVPPVLDTTKTPGVILPKAQELAKHYGVTGHRMEAVLYAEAKIAATARFYIVDDPGKTPLIKMAVNSSYRTSGKGVVVMMMSPVFNENGDLSATLISLQVWAEDGRIVGTSRLQAPLPIFLTGIEKKQADESTYVSRIRIGAQPPGSLFPLPLLCCEINTDGKAANKIHEDDPKPVTVKNLGARLAEHAKKH